MNAGTEKLPTNHAELGRCVICGAPGTSQHDFICADCGDPLAVTLYCLRCERRLALNQEAASAFLADNGYDFDDLRGLVLKVTCCSRCMGPDERSDLSIYRIRFGALES
ncbi:MAG: hypothetical protein GXP54_05170 [Deltaproteobacteria bacterium]|nr:hypothetical protein [Deltaproteobacteria bacterium]